MVTEQVVSALWPFHIAEKDVCKFLQFTCAKLSFILICSRLYLRAIKPNVCNQSPCRPPGAHNSLSLALYVLWAISSSHFCSQMYLQFAGLYPSIKPITPPLLPHIHHTLCLILKMDTLRAKGVVAIKRGYCQPRLWYFLKHYCFLVFCWSTDFHSPALILPYSSPRSPMPMHFAWHLLFCFSHWTLLLAFSLSW